MEEEIGGSALWAQEGLSLMGDYKVGPEGSPRIYRKAEKCGQGLSGASSQTFLDLRNKEQSPLNQEYPISSLLCDLREVT